MTLLRVVAFTGALVFSSASAGAQLPLAGRASDLSGQVTFSGRAVPGATVTATKGDRTVTTASSDDGSFRFANLDDGTWSVRVEMRGFAGAMRDAALPRATDAEPLTVALTLLPYAEILAGAPPASVTPPAATASTPLPIGPDEIAVVTGSVINGATTPFAQPRAFGNNRPRPASLYTYSVGAVMGNSAWNARPYSLLGSTAPSPAYGDYQADVTVGGPLRIPWLIDNGPRIQFSYQHGNRSRATTASALMPTVAERSGDFSQSSTPVRDPLTGQPFTGNVIPSSRIDGVAASLLAYYPLPSSTGVAASNFQRPIVVMTRTDGLQFGLTKTLPHRMSLAGTVNWRRVATESVSLFDFEDRNRQSSVTASVTWSRQVSSRLSLRGRYQLDWSVSRVTPFFAGRVNVSGDAGVTGNDQDASNWGPPTLVFPGIAGLTDAEAQRTVNTAHTAGVELLARRGAHNITVGGDFRWMLADVGSAPNPRGTLTFTGAASGHAFADFLLGIPSASSIAFGSAAHLRGVSPDVYINDDWRILPTLTVNAGLRWEYDSPFSESSGHLVNLDVVPGFSAVAPVLADDPVGTLTGRRYPASLVRPDKRGFQPRVGASWRPSLSSSTVVKGSYGVYRNLGGYQPLALLLSQQAPFARAFSIENTSATPLTLANPFPVSLPAASNTFAIDPDFRPSYAHTWQVSLQRELPRSLTLLVSYLGTHGSHLMQAFLPNTEAPGSVGTPTGPKGFIYVTSAGTSRRHAAQITLRRRLYAGFMASVDYTLAKATDDAASFGSRGLTPAALSVAQDWRNLAAERSPSSFDQRHRAEVTVQYTTGAGLKGGTLVDGLWGALWKDWTVATELNVGSGLPFTPVAFLPVAGTGVVGIRPALTGVSVRPIASHTYANPEAFAAPSRGSWGDAGRNSLRGPGQFSMNLTVARVFRIGERRNLEWRLAANNVLNRVTFAAVDAIVGSPQFGRPTVANSMRTLQMTLLLRF
jgi:trimeric autotransporter adhesin